MNIDNLLAYQVKDLELHKLEKDLYEGSDKKIINDMIVKVKESQNKSLQLERTATDLNNEFESLKKSYDENIKKLNMMSNSDIEKLSEVDLASFDSGLNNLIANLDFIENKLSYFAKSMNVILSDFENAKKSYEKARTEYSAHKKLYDDQYNQAKPLIDEKVKELTALEKGIDPKLLQKYKAKRQDKKFPILVALSGTDCGGCQMQLSYASLNTLKENGIIECEHCRRLIYVK